MFSGLGNLDLNATFNQFSATFSLDDLQKEKAEDGIIKSTYIADGSANSTAAASGGESSSYTGDLKLAEDILKLREMLKQKDIELNDITNRFMDNTKQLQVEKIRNDELDNKINVLNDEINSRKLSEKSITEDYRQLERQMEQLQENSVAIEQGLQERYSQLMDDYQALQNRQQQESVVSSDDGCTSNASSSDENIAKLTADCRNLETSLTQSKSKIERLETQLQKNKEVLKETKAKLTASEDNSRNLMESTESAQKELQRQLAALQSELKTSKEQFKELDSSASAKQLQLQHELGLSEENFQSAQLRTTQLESEVEALKAAIQQTSQQSGQLTEDLMNEMQVLNSTISEQVGQIAKLNDEKLALESQLNAHKNTIVSLTSELEQNMSHSSSNSAAIEENVRKYHLKETQCTELEAKVTSLTEKIKEVMTRLVESKQKVTITEQQCEAKIAELAKTTHSKETEVLSLRLKLENIERHSSDHRIKTTELAERYGEAQKEITRLHQNSKELNAKIESLSEEIIQLQSQITVLTEERDNAQEQLQSSLLSTQQIDATHTREIQTLTDKLTQLEIQHKAHIAEYELELSSVQTRIKNDTESADVLDGYKKRAQVALKKANAVSAQLTAENEKLQAQLDNNTERLEEVETLLSEGEKRESELASKISQLELELFTAKQELDAAVALSQKLSSTTSDTDNKDYQELFAKTRQLEATIANLNQDAVDNKNTIRDLLHQQQQHTSAERNRSDSSGSSAALKIELPSTLPAVQSQEHLPHKVVDQTSWARSAARTHSPHTQQTNNNHNVVVNDSSSNAAAVPHDSHEMVTVSLSRSNSIDAANSSTGYLPSGGKVGIAAIGETSGTSMLVTELHSQMDHLKRELAQRGIDVEAAHQELQYEREENKNLKNRVEELLAFLDRTKKLHEGPDSAINMEYLKNCVVKFMETNELSEKKRLFPVIAMILKLTTLEKERIHQALVSQESEDKDTITPFGAIGSIAESFWGYSSNALLGTSTTHSTHTSGTSGGMHPIKISNSRTNLMTAATSSQK